MTQQVRSLFARKLLQVPADWSSVPDKLLALFHRAFFSVVGHEYSIRQPTLAQDPLGAFLIVLQTRPASIKTLAHPVTFSPITSLTPAIARMSYLIRLAMYREACLRDELDDPAATSILG